MTLPGHSVTIGERVAARLAPASASNGFLVGASERGATDRAILLRSSAEAEELIGARTSESAPTLDYLDVAFREGAQAIYFSRLVGPAVATSDEDLLDSGNAAIGTVTALSPGAWGDDIDVTVGNVSGGTFTVSVSYLGSVVETSPTLSNLAELELWAANSNYIRFDASGTNDPKAQTIALTGGLSDSGAATQTHLQTALDRFTRDLGPGQVVAPFFTSGGRASTHAKLLAHAVANNRRALLDFDDAARAAVVSAAAGLRGTDGDRFAAGFAPYAVVPGLSKGTTRTVPYSAVQLGLIARAEAAGQNPNRAAAGKWGRARYAIELSQHFTDADRELLNEAGVNVATLIRGVVTTYGNRTLANPLTADDWKWFSASRLVMAIAAATEVVLEDYDFEQIDGHGHVFGELQGAISGRACMPFYLADALYGTTPDEAFQVNTGPDVNTPSTIALGEIHAQVAIRVSESGEVLSVEIVKVPTTEEL